MFSKISGMILVLLAAASFAAAPSRVAADANYVWSLDSTIRSTAALCTTTTNDSTSAILNNWYPKPGYEYILVRGTLTGTNAASVTMALNMHSYDQSGNLIQSVVVDSATAAAGEAYVLPVGQSIFGTKFRVIFNYYGTSGAQVIWNRFYLYKRQVLNSDKRLW